MFSRSRRSPDHARCRGPRVARFAVLGWDYGDSLRFRFFLHRDLHLAHHVAMQADWHFELADVLERLIELDLAAVNVEALALQRLGDIRRGDRTEQVVFLAGFALEAERGAVQLFGQ